MKRVFADTAYWLALTNSFDQYHTKALEVSEALGPCRLFTTDLRNPHVAVIPMSRRMFTRSLTLYKARPDKGYSLTDCSSMLLMRQHHLSEALTTDQHFEQEGFAALLRVPTRRHPAG